MQRRPFVCASIFICLLVLSCVFRAAAQDTATLSGTVVDPQGLAVRGAKVTVTNAATGAERSIAVDDNGRYIFIGLTPGRYKMSVEGGANFGVFHNDSIIVTVAEHPTFNPRLDITRAPPPIIRTTTPPASETSQ